MKVTDFEIRKLLKYAARYKPTIRQIPNYLSIKIKVGNILINIILNATNGSLVVADETNRIIINVDKSLRELFESIKLTDDPIAILLGYYKEIYYDKQKEQHKAQNIIARLCSKWKRKILHRNVKPLALPLLRD